MAQLVHWQCNTLPQCDIHFQSLALSNPAMMTAGTCFGAQPGPRASDAFLAEGRLLDGIVLPESRCVMLVGAVRTACNAQ